MTAEELIELLDLSPHSEGGHYRRTWTVPEPNGEHATNIYVLFQKGDVTTWHRKTSATLWHHYMGGPLVISQAPSRHGPRRDDVLGTDIVAGERPQLPMPSNVWQRTECLAEFTLAGVTVAPGFQWQDFVLAPPGFDIPKLKTRPE